MKGTGWKLKENNNRDVNDLQIEDETSKSDNEKHGISSKHVNNCNNIIPDAFASDDIENNNQTSDLPYKHL